MRRIFYFIPLFVLLIILSSCEKKFNLDLLNADKSSGNIGGDTVYIQINPAWGGYNNPQAIMIGKEPFIYIADTDNNRVVMLNLDGDILGFRSFEKPIALAEDYRLNLFVCAKFDTLVAGQQRTLNAVFKLDLVASQHNIAAAPMERILPRTNSDINNPERKYTGVAVFYDNSYIVCRTGPNNSTLIDPDNSLLSFVVKHLPDGTEKDSLIGRIAGLDPIGAGVPSAFNLSSVSSFNKRDYDVITTLIGNTSFKVQWLHYVNTRDFTGYQNYISPQSSEIMFPNRFSQPEDATLDDAENIFVVDAAKDSVFKFNPFGDLLQSFGGSGVFKSPQSVAFFDKTLYVADSGNNRILRFVLSTDIQ